MEEQPETEAEQAQRALEALADTRRRIAQRARWPLRRHMAFGALVGILVASDALPTPGQIGAVALMLLGTLLLVRYDRRRDGFFVNGYRAGRTRRVAFLFLGVALLGLAVAIVAKLRFGLVWVPLVAGVVIAVLGTMASLAWERAYRADLTGTP